ncbi:thiamine pyrophosphate-dependent enzyme [Actinokineospora sp. 24-640]
MNRTAAIRAIIAATTAEPVVFTTEASCRTARSIADRRNHLYLTAGMGMASSLGIGVAMQARRTTVVVDAYGSLARNPMGLITAGTLAELPLVHVVLDDGLFAAAQNSSSPSGRADLCALARAAGYASVTSTARADRFAALLRGHISTATRPVLLRCLLSEPDVPANPAAGEARVADLPAHARRFHDTLVGLPRTA